MTKQQTHELIDTTPKAELHLHIEGTFEPELMFKIAKRNGVQLKYDSVENLKAAYNFNNLQEFLDIYYSGANALITEQDFYDLTTAYLKKCKEDNVVHTEIFFDPQTHTQRGVAFKTVVNGICKACEEAKNDWGISSFLIPNFLRHLSEEDAIKTFREALEFGDKFIAFGLDSSEIGNPPKKFKRVFEMVKSEGFKTVAHAGEEGPVKNIIDAIEILKVSRIDHGVRAIDDLKLLENLAKTQMPLTVCPLSNLKLKVVKKMGDHPIKRLLDKNIVVTVNSDDPAYFGGYANDNFYAISDALNLAGNDILALAKNSFKASFLLEKEKNKWISSI